MRLLVIVDLDGTLYDNTPNAHLIPEDRTDTEKWAEFNCACDTHVLRHAVASLVHTLILSSAIVIYLTGRGDIARDATTRRLHSDGLMHHTTPLLMRKMSDRRPSWVYKLEAIAKIMAENPNYHVVALEDDPAIVEALRKQSITTLQIDSLCADVRSKYAKDSPEPE